MFYVLLWVGLVAVSLAVGPVWRVISPMRTLYRISLSPLHFGRRTYPARLGYFPAAFGLFAFVWLELASPNPGSLTAIKLWLLVYVVVMAARRRGVRRPMVRASRPVRGVQRRRVTTCRRSGAIPRPAASSSATRSTTCRRCPSARASSTVLAVLLGSTAFDSFSATPGWRNFVDDLAHGSPVTATLVRTGGLVVFAIGCRRDVFGGGLRDGRSGPTLSAWRCPGRWRTR